MPFCVGTVEFVASAFARGAPFAPDMIMAIRRGSSLSRVVVTEDDFIHRTAVLRWRKMGTGE